MLNSQELIDRAIVTGPIEEDNIAQHGIDLNVTKISKVVGNPGRIPREGKTTLPQYEEQQLKSGIWTLEKGVYDLQFAQGCKVPSDRMMLIKHRSSVLRSGAVVDSGIFDAGFETEHLGAFLLVHHTIEIEYFARVAQAVAFACGEVSNLYDGQWQHDNQRNTDG